MSVNLAALKAGTVVWTKGQNEFSDGATGGAFIRRSHDPETGEEVATILTYQAATPRQGSLHLLDRRGGNRDLGLVARLIRVPMSEVRMPHDDHRDWRKVHAYALRALLAAALPPNNDIESRHHGAYVDAYMVLMYEAVELHRGNTA